MFPYSLLKASKVREAWCWIWGSELKGFRDFNLPRGCVHAFWRRTKESWDRSSNSQKDKNSRCKL